MRSVNRVGQVLILASAVLAAGPACPGIAAPPPGKPYVLTIKGENTLTFVPEAGLPPLPIDYKARIEYLVKTREIAAVAPKGAAARKKTRRKSVRETRPAGEEDAPKAAAAVDLAIHSAELALRQREQMVVQARISRARFQGRLLPDAPVLTVSYYQAPPAVQALLDRFDATAATILLDDRANAIERRVRFEGPLHAIVETLLSIHTPIPRDVATWEAPTRLAMGHGQTATGTLKFEKDKASVKDDGGLVKVKVSGTLEAEGAIVGNLIRGGSYRVIGEQSYDPPSREWRSARWSVEIETELENQQAIVARGRGKMLVESRAVEIPPPAGVPKRGKPATGRTATPADPGAPVQPAGLRRSPAR